MSLKDVKKINKKNSNADKTVMLRKKINPNSLGREIYADQVDTPYSIYLTRKLYLAKDYQKLAEGEAFFDVLCESWDQSENFKDLVVKRIYLYVETEKMYFTMLLGYFEPLEKEERIRLKKWIAELPTEKSTKALTPTNSLGDMAELKEMMQRLMDTSGEMYHLRQTIFQLDEKIEQNKLELPSGNPVISRSIRTIHLKRAQPLLVEDSVEQLTQKESIKDVVIDVEVEEKAPKKPLTLVRENSSRLDEKKKKTQEENLSLNRLDEKTSLTTQAEAAAKSEELLEPPFLVLILENTKKLSPKDKQAFLKVVEKAKIVKAPPKHAWVASTELEKLEDKVYFKFVSKRARNYSRKTSSPKVSISKQEFRMKLKQAEKAADTWETLFKDKETDVWICGRLSCINLIEGLPEFLEEMQEIAYNRNFIGLKIRCSTDLLNRLEGYILLNKYLRRLAKTPQEEQEKKTYF